MRNMKRIISLMLAVSLLLSSMTVAFAAVSEDVTICETLGIIKGDGNGVTEAYANSMPTRVQAALMQLRFMGLEEEATNFTFVEGETETFKDAATADASWQPIMAYLKANPDLGWIGYPDGSFKPNDKVDFLCFTKALLEAIGYKYGEDFTWDGAEDGIAAFALSLNVETQTGVFDMSEACAVIVDLLVAETADGTMLIDDLIAAGIVTLEDAVEAGIKEMPTELEALTATMPNLAEIVVTFNQDINVDAEKELEDADTASEFEKYFVVKNDSLSNDPKVAVLKAVVEGAVVTLTVEDTIEAQHNIDLIVTDELLKEEKTFNIDNVIDATLPTVVSVVTSGPNKFDITFSEPLSVAPSVEINSGEIGAEPEGFEVGDSKVTILANDDLEPGVTYDLEITDAKDYAGYKMLKYTTTVTYEAVEEVLTVEVTEVTETKVTVVFSQDLDKATKEAVTTTNSGIFWHSFDSYKPVSVAAVSDKEFDIIFAEDASGHYIPYAEVTFTVEKEDKDDDALTDVWGNKMAEDFVTTIASEKDETVPTVKLVSAKEAKIVVAFSEDVTGVENGVTVKDADDDEVAVSSVAITDADNDEYTITFKKPVDGGKYTVEFKGVKDKSLAANKMNPNPTVLTVTISDSTAPDLSETTSVLAGKNKLYVKFPEAMDDSVLDVDMYTATSAKAVGADEIIVPVKAEFFGSSNKEVKLTFADKAVITTGEGMLIVGKVADASGNYVKDLSTPVTISAVEAVAINGLKTVSENRMAVTIDGKIPAGNVDNDYIVITDHVSKLDKEPLIAVAELEKDVTSTAAAIKSVDYNSDKDETIITFSLRSEITIGAAEVDFTVSISDEMEDNRGFSVTTGAYGYENGDEVKDGIAPSVTSHVAVYINDIRKISELSSSITVVGINFDEFLSTTYEALMVDDLIIVVDGDTLKAGIDYATWLEGSVKREAYERYYTTAVIIEFLNDDYDYTNADITINTVESPKFIMDLSGNEIDKIDEIKINPDDWEDGIRPHID